jgi:hypothetical protein
MADTYSITPGIQFNYLTFLSDAGRANGRKIGQFRCVCGQEKILIVREVTSGKTKSCGCFRRSKTIAGNTKHGHAKRNRASPEYVCWAGMIVRCEDPKADRYARYGGRGITVCARWHTFENFLADMGIKPSPEHSIERNNANGHYEPGNCRWATRTEQANNTARNRFIEHMGRRQTVVQWARELGILDKTIYERLRKGWPMERVLDPIKPEYKSQWATRRSLRSNS